MEDDNENQQERQEWTFTRTIKTFLPLISIFAALCYFLGRLHIESYYCTLGITTDTLIFNIYDYMFSSYDLVIMCLFVVIFLYLYWHSATQNASLWGGYPIRDEDKELDNLFLSAHKDEILDSYKKKREFLSWFDKKDYISTSINNKKIYIVLAYLLWIFCILWHFNIFHHPFFDNKGFIGFYTGYAVGHGALIFAYYLGVRRGGKIQGIKIVAVIFLILVLLPSVTMNLVQKEVIRDRVEFPKVTVMCKVGIPAQLQIPSTSNSTNSITGRLIITNNGFTYLTDYLNDEWQCYSIPTDIIEYIKYFSEK